MARQYVKLYQKLLIGPEAQKRAPVVAAHSLNERVHGRKAETAATAPHEPSGRGDAAVRPLMAPGAIGFCPSRRRTSGLEQFRGFLILKAPPTLGRLVADFWGQSSRVAGGFCPFCSKEELDMEHERFSAWRLARLISSIDHCLPRPKPDRASIKPASGACRLEEG